MGNFLIKRLFPDGSSRHFFRISSKSFSLVIMYNPVFKDGISENDSYYYIGTHLYHKGIPVPRIYLYDRDNGILWMEDLGETHLQDVVDFKKDPDGSIKWYEILLDTMKRLCVDGAYGFDPGYCYDTSLYNAGFILQRELNYFYREFLRSYMKIIPPKGIEKEFRRLAEAVSEIPNNFLIHRDFQSRNIMVRDGRIYIIDFQGARFGPPTYDLASLVIDPYVDMPDHLQFYLIKEYFIRIKRYLPYSEDEFLQFFWKTALCRNLQILGAFSFLSLKKGKPFFRRFIPTALCQLKKILGYLGDEFPLITDLTQKLPFYTIYPIKITGDVE